MAAALALLVVAWFLILERSLSLNQLGKQLFGVTTFFAGLFAYLCGAVYSADSLSVERREGTLGLLFLTDLKGYDVLLGNLKLRQSNGSLKADDLQIVNNLLAK